MRDPSWTAEARIANGGARERESFLGAARCARAGDAPSSLDETIERKDEWIGKTNPFSIGRIRKGRKEWISGRGIRFRPDKPQVGSRRELSRKPEQPPAPPAGWRSVNSRLTSWGHRRGRVASKDPVEARDEHPSPPFNLDSSKGTDRDRFPFPKGIVLGRSQGKGCLAFSVGISTRNTFRRRSDAPPQPSTREKKEHVEKEWIERNPRMERTWPKRRN